MGILNVSGETKLWVCEKNLHVLNVSPVVHHGIFSKVTSWASLSFHWLKY